MKSLKIRLSIILALAVTFLAAVGAFFGTGTFANADRDTTVDGSSSTLFNASAGADLRAHEQTVKGEGEEETKEYYTMFAVKEEGGEITYKKHLAYEWYANTAKTTEKEGEGEGAVEKEVEDLKNPVRSDKNYFNMEVGFENLNFKKYIIKFESQQYYKTKDEKTSNYVIFFPAAEENKVNVLITDDEDGTVDDAATTALIKDHIKIEFTGTTNDGYAVKVSAEGVEVTGEFKNVGGTHAKYTSTSNLTVIPLSFKAELLTPAEGESAKPALITLYSLNGQSFKLKSAKKEEGNDYFTGTTVVDNTPPVLCLNSGISFIKRGEQISFDYTVIDVLQSNPSSTLSYYILTNDQAEGKVENFNPEDMSDTKLFTEVTSGSVQRVIPRVEHYVPVEDNYKTDKFDKNVKVTAAVKAFIKLTDYSYTGGQSTYVLVDWYVNDDLLLTVGEGANTKKYLAVANDELGATFNYNETSGTATTSNPKSEQWSKILDAYQKEVNKAAKGLKAGSKNYFYLPALDNIDIGGTTASLLGDNVTSYKDLSFSIYYNNGSQQSPVTGKKYNELSIPITQEGDYGFTIYAQDAASSEMYYLDANGEKQEFAASDIWTMHDDTDQNDKGVSKSDYLPWFTFHVGAAQLSIEEPKEQDIAYVQNTANVSFEINGVSGSYTTTYTLYLFDSAEYYNYAHEALTYEKFMELKQQLFENTTGLTDENGKPVNSRRWFETIQITSGDNKIDENSADFKKYEDYKWNGSSSFEPQNPNAFYLVTCEVKGTDGQTDKAYMGIAAAPKVRDLAGEDTWLEDNMVSVILLCVAGASLIGIILLLVIRPKDKGDVDVDFETENVKKPKSKKKSKNS